MDRALASAGMPATGMTACSLELVVSTGKVGKPAFCERHAAVVKGAVTQIWRTGSNDPAEHPKPSTVLKGSGSLSGKTGANNTTALPDLVGQLSREPLNADQIHGDFAWPKP